MLTRDADRLARQALIADIYRKQPVWNHQQGAVYPKAASASNTNTYRGNRGNPCTGVYWEPLGWSTLCINAIDIVAKVLYRLSAEARVPTLPDRDSNRSDYLSLRYMSHSGEAQYRAVQGSEAQFLIRYHIASDRPASEGKAVVFDPDLNPIHERTLTGDDLNPAGHIVVVFVPVDRLSKPGKYLFLIGVKDNHADADRSHRRLWALPLTLTFAYKQVKLTDPPLVEGSPMLFRGLPMPCPVLIKGEVLPGEQGVRPNIVLTVEKGYLDENDVWHVVEEERPVPETELDWNPEEDVWWDNQSGV